MIFIIKSGKRNGKRLEAEWKEGNKLFKMGYSSKQNVAADGSVMISKFPNPELVFVAERGEEIVEI